MWGGTSSFCGKAIYWGGGRGGGGGSLREALPVEYGLVGGGVLVFVAAASRVGVGAWARVRVLVYPATGVCVFFAQTITTRSSKSARVCALSVVDLTLRSLEHSHHHTAGYAAVLLWLIYAFYLQIRKK